MNWYTQQLCQFWDTSLPTEDKETPGLSNNTLDEIFHPKSIAVVGASQVPTAWGYSYIHHLLDYGYKGTIYPVNPRYSDVLGLKAYPSIKEVPGTVDYVISCIPSSQVLALLDDCAQKGVKGIHLYTARFSETGRKEAAALEQEIREKARSLGIRLIGPNCMGVYYPGGGQSFAYALPKEPGKVGLASQTGGGASGLIHLASLRGVRFSKAISYGNALDLNECDFLDYFAHDPETEVVLMYIEAARGGKRFFDTLRRVASIKPVIVLKGGKRQAGIRMTASHTASMAGSVKTWEAAVAQAGAVWTESLEEMADLAVSFYFLPPIRGYRAGIVGAGGGASVLAADECEGAGLDVIPIPAELRETLKSKGVPLWDWIGNPVDVSIIGDSGFTHIDMLGAMARTDNFDFFIVYLNELELLTIFQEQEVTVRLKKNTQGFLKARDDTGKPLLAVVGEKSLGADDCDHWSTKRICEMRSELIVARTPIYPTMGRAARAVKKLIDYYDGREQIRNSNI